MLHLEAFMHGWGTVNLLGMYAAEVMLLGNCISACPQGENWYSQKLFVLPSSILKSSFKVWPRNSNPQEKLQFTDKPLANFSLFPPLQYCGWNPESSALYQWAATPGLSQFLINRYTVLTSEGLLGVTNVATLDVKRINYSILFMRRLPYLGYRLIHVDPLFWSWFRWSWCCWCGWCVCRATRWFLCWCFSSLWFSFRRNLNMHMKSFQYK